MASGSEAPQGVIAELQKYSEDELKHILDVYKQKKQPMLKKERNKKYYDKNRDKVLSHQRDLYIKNKEQYLQRQKYYYYKRTNHLDKLKTKYPDILPLFE